MTNITFSPAKTQLATLTLNDQYSKKNIKFTVQQNL